jgi:RNA polymerase sigma factor (sigma-70 family)
MDLSSEGRELLAACLAEAPAERRRAYEALGQRLQRMLWPRVAADPRLHPLAEDCAQEALLKIHQQLAAGRGPDDPDRFLAWAARIAANRLIDHLRLVEPATSAARARRVALSRQVSLDADPDGGDERPLGDLLADPEGEDVAQAMEAQELLQLLSRIRTIQSVSERSRTVLLRGYLQEQDDEDLAAELDTNRRNIHVIRCRDLEKLRHDEAFMAALRRWREALP